MLLLIKTTFHLQKINTTSQTVKLPNQYHISISRHTHHHHTTQIQNHLLSNNNFSFFTNSTIRHPNGIIKKVYDVDKILPWFRNGPLFDSGPFPNHGSLLSTALSSSSAGNTQPHSFMLMYKVHYVADEVKCILLLEDDKNETFKLKDDKLRGRPGYKHLNEQLHILIDADLPPSVVDLRLRQVQKIIDELLKLADGPEDYIKRMQLRELAMLNSNFRKQSPGPTGSVSRFNTSGMKHPITGREQKYKSRGLNQSCLKCT